jgi:Family of unknown function (DUF6272)
MRSSVAHSLFSALRGERTVFIYSGAFREDHSARLIALGEAVTEDRRGQANGRGRLAFVMVEAYQNILRHRSPLSPALAKGDGRSLFFLKCSEACQQVVACNPVLRTSVAALEAVLGDLQGLDPEQLKAKYLAVLQREHDGKRKGAGLGLIEMTRRSGNVLHYELLPLDEQHALLTLAIRLGSQPDREQAFAEVRRMHQTSAEEDILLVHMGPVDPASQEALLRMLEEDLEDRAERAELRGRVYLAAQNVFGRLVHPGAHGFLAVARQGSHHTVSMGYELSEPRTTAFAEQVARYGTMDRMTLDRHYRHALLEKGTTTDDADLLELMRLSVEPVVLTSFPGKGEHRFVLLQAIV